MRSGRWIAIEKNIAHYTPDEFADELFAMHPELRQIEGTKLPKGARIDVIGVVFPEELTWRHLGQGWVFLVRVQRKDRSISKFLVRAGRAGESDLRKRIPELWPLQYKTIAIVGTGCLGAPSCIELARAGAKELRLLDGDFVEPGTIVRWPLGFAIAGRNKVEALSYFIKANYPWTGVSANVHRIGLSFPNSPSDIESLQSLLDGVHLLYDATAELDLQRMLSDVAKSVGVHYVGVSSTPGGWGERVIRIAAENDACRACLDYHIADGAVPVPVSSPHGMTEAPGCNAPTFTAANFDTSEVALMGVRVATSTLCAGEHEAYAEYKSDVSILKLRDDHGGLIPPDWKGFPLSRHPQCQNH